MQAFGQWLQLVFQLTLYWATALLVTLGHPLYLFLRFFFILPLFSLLSLSLLFYLFILKDLPSPRALDSFTPKLTTQIFDRHGRLLYRLYQDENRLPVSLDDIPLYLRQATIAIEDKNFYQHQGLSFTGILRALHRNLTSNSLEGGSTITQQLIKNTLLSREKTIIRKIKEIILAIHTELVYDKRTILSLYLNQVAYGGTAYGVQAAAQQYFHKDVANLSLAQAAFLAGLPQAPSRYSPYAPDPTLGLTRLYQVLQRMFEDGYLTQQQLEKAAHESLSFYPPTTQIQAPHFVMYIKDLLAAYFGEDLVNHGGLQVHTTLDLDIQKAAEDTVIQEVDRLKNLQVTNGAALVLVPNSGEVLAMVGSKNYFDFQNDGQVNLTLRPRQPGSAVKPINYALAFEKGFQSSSLIDDSPITFNLPGQRPWSPKNYDNRFHGTITLRSALANSYNIPAVKLLAANGISQMDQLGQNMGITTWDDPTRLGLSLTLGALEVRMLDLAKVYATFANLGETTPINPILSITDHQGQPLTFIPCSPPDTPANTFKAQAAEIPCLPQRTLTPQTAYLINDILSDPQARANAFGYNSILNIKDHQVAVKTGTSNDLRDNWTFGYTQDFVVATWVGNNDNTPMNQVASGITGASPIWNQIMTQLLANRPNHQFALPNTLVKINICSLTNTLPCNSCPYIRPEIYSKGQEPKVACTDNQVQKVLDSKLTQQTVTPHPQILPEAATTTRSF